MFSNVKIFHVSVGIFLGLGFCASIARPVVSHALVRSVPVEQTLDFCAFGDWGAEPDSHGIAPVGQRRVATALLQRGCRKILLLGDNFYPTGISSLRDPRWEQSFLTPYRALIDLGAQFLVSLGNHDYMQAAGPDTEVRFSRDPRAQHRMPDGTLQAAWFMGDEPARYYRKDVSIPGSNKFACFFALDTNQFDSVSQSAAQRAWLANSLRETTSCSWKIAFGHHPIVSSGEHGNGNQRLQTLLRPSLAGIDLYIAGHDHHFGDEGSYPAIAVPLSIPSEKADRFQAPQGTPRFRQLVIGSGGASLYRVPRRAFDSKHFIQRVFGFGSFKLNPTKIEWEFVDSSNRSLYRAEMGR